MCVCVITSCTFLQVMRYFIVNTVGHVMDLKRSYIIVFEHQNLSEEVEFLGLDGNWGVLNRTL